MFGGVVDLFRRAAEAPGRYRDHDHAGDDQYEARYVSELIARHRDAAFAADEAGAVEATNRSNRSTRNPKPMSATEVRTQARNVRSFAA